MFNDAENARQDFLQKALIGRRREEGPLALHTPHGVQRFARHDNPDGSSGGWVSEDAQVAPTVWTTCDTIVDDMSRITGHGRLEEGFYPSRSVIDLDLRAARSA